MPACATAGCILEECLDIRGDVFTRNTHLTLLAHEELPLEVPPRLRGARLALHDFPCLTGILAQHQAFAHEEAAGRFREREAPVGSLLDFFVRGKFLPAEFTAGK
eukprot:CAMPEP_0171607954 /NCGR_PEP_ID=MMETSP0990-20121206/8635_1 /TAXON_ID=483369 /ORGANISM="non described non described, Strain CCMP2098" /LENGTH=104 /DNA_ID=CAMNT_0012171019 /DNA_START=354 /DNA_END=668 /DNA_ORIENTATION=+